MQWVKVGDRVRVDIPDKGDLDHERLHRKPGTVTAVHEDEASEITGDPTKRLPVHCTTRLCNCPKVAR